MSVIYGPILLKLNVRRQIGMLYGILILHLTYIRIQDAPSGRNRYDVISATE